MRPRLLHLLITCALLLLSTPAHADPSPLQWHRLDPYAATESYGDFCYGRGLFVAGSDAGMIGLSADGRAWEPLRLGLSISTLNCDGPNYVGIAGLTTSGIRFAESTDGRTWFTSTWQTSGPARAKIAYGNGRWLAYVGAQLATSTDSLTWTTLAPGFPAPYTDLRFGGGRFVIVAGGRLYSSVDGGSWTLASGPVGAYGLLYNNGQWLATAQMPVSAGRIATLVGSTDGRTWTAVRTIDPTQPMTKGESLDRLAFLHGRYYAGGTTRDPISNESRSVTLESLDGRSWDSRLGFLDGVVSRALPQGDGWVSLRNPHFVVSPNAVDWNPVGDEISTADIAYGDGTWIAVQGSDLLVSQDGELWHSHPFGHDLPVAIAWGAGHWVATNRVRQIFVSADGTDWTAVGLEAYNHQIVYGTNQFLTIGTDAQLYGSADGATWAPLGPLPVPLADAYILAWISDRYYLFTRQGAFRSVDGRTWAPVALPSGHLPLHGASGGGLLMLVGGERIATSTDGTTWSASTFPAGMAATDLIYTGDRFLAHLVSEAHLGVRYLGESTDGRTWQTYPLTNMNVSALRLAGGKSFVITREGGLLTPQNGPACGAAYPDLSPRRFGCTAVRVLTGRAIIEGYPDGTFRPDETLTRAAFAKLVTLAMGEAPDPAGELPFPDTTGHWAAQAGYLQTAYRLGLIQGFPDGNFYPDAPVTRAQAVKIMVMAAGLPAPDPAGPGTPWYDPWYRTAKNRGLIAPVVRLYFWGWDMQADPVATREQAVVLIHWYLQRSP